MYIKKNEKSGPKAFSNDEFDEKIKDSDYIRIGNYINAETPIEFECKLCGKKTIKKPRFFNRSLCDCKKETNNSYSSLGRKITNEEFDLRIKHLDFMRIDNYVNTNTHINFKCKICNKIINKTPKKITKYICDCKIIKPLLNKQSVKYIDKFLILLENKKLRLIDNYLGYKTLHCFECLNCKEIIVEKPINISKRKVGCLSCSNYHLSHSKYQTLLPNDIELVKNQLYINCDTNLYHKCKTCDYIWATRPRVIIYSKCGCPNCSSSKGERQIKNWLDIKGIEYIKEFQQKIGNSTYRFDFYLPKKELFIEFNGIQHYEPREFFGGEDQFEVVKRNDLLKDNWVFENKKELLKISYEQNVEKILEEKITYKK
jgi:hypothetical protein